jgi:hypothetical protein
LAKRNNTWSIPELYAECSAAGENYGPIFRTRTDTSAAAQVGSAVVRCS